MGLNLETRSRIYDFDSIEADDEFDTELAKAYARYRDAAENKSEIEIHNYLQDKASQNKKEYNDVVSALLYGALTEPGKARMFFQSISFVNRDNFASIVTKLQVLTTSIKFQNLKLAVRDQIFWLISELTSLNVQNVDTLYLCLMRQIRGGDVGQPNVLLCEQILKLFEVHKVWLGTSPRVIATAVYTYLRTIADHRTLQLQSLQQKEIRFVINLMREKWMLCVPIGRDLIRILYDLRAIPDIKQFWDTLLNSPQSISPKFKGIDTVLKTPTPKEFLRCRITPDIEFKLLFILQNLRITQYQRNLTWFVQRFLNTPEAEPFYADVIRFIVAGWYPSNQILQSDIVPRYVIIGSMMRSIKSNVVLTNVKTALVYDWLFFTSTDNIMFIEPAMLLMERSAERYPGITALIMEFLKKSVDEYFPPLRDYMASCVTCGMRVLLNKGVIRSLIPIYRCPATESITRDYMQALFSEFLVEDKQQSAVLPSSVSMQPSGGSGSESNAMRSMPSTPKSENVEYPSEQQQQQGDIDYDSNQKSQQTPKLAIMTPMKDDEDVDAYLYGQSDTEMENTVVNDTEKSVEDTPLPPSEDTDMNDTNEDTMLVVEDEKEEEETDGLQSHQSYWIFGDSLKRFKEASANAIATLREGNVEQYSELNMTSKKNLKEILAVFLRMAIPAETLGSAIGAPIRNIVVSNLLIHNSTPNSMDSVDEDTIVQDPTKDVFDLIMATFWSSCNNDASRDKVIRLIGCIAHTKKTSKTKRHIIGMRWWSFIAGQLGNEQVTESLDISEWFPSIIINYKAYVSHAFSVEESTIDKSDYLREYLKGDLQALADKNIVYFNDIIPLLYQYLPNVTVGDLDILKLTLLMLLPETVGKLTCNLYSDSTRIFGNQISTFFVSDSLALTTYETTHLWQLLAAELQGKSDEIYRLFQQPQVIHAMKTNFKIEILPSLFSILTSIPPSKDLMYAILQIMPATLKVTQPQTQFILASLQYWSQQRTDEFLSSLSELTEWITDQIENEEDRSGMATQLLHVLTIWWDQKSASESFKLDKKVLFDLFKLGNLVAYTCPKEWSLEQPRKKKRPILLDSDEDE
ncbi:protein-domain-containing protein [Gilbertella persicaria]|uniref:Integrator complex subunit 3 n=1 Tax=Rhizopus stolonifer TaxID=4846 RepID=A0A367KQK0_RHIST|nr:protein-domain-containing protein [Gilbertella persicaria]KAI8078947.1 protein-domain-containing protein [Gilbertella persicaria]RCI04142.1 Integrator complex subunit 3 [Rhizopus stolonifer]